MNGHGINEAWRLRPERAIGRRNTAIEANAPLHHDALPIDAELVRADMVRGVQRVEQAGEPQILRECCPPDATKATRQRVLPLIAGPVQQRD